MQTKKILLITAVLGALTIASCDKDDLPRPTKTFKVTIENVFETKDYFDSGTTGFLEPGMSESITFHAGKGHYLSFATMFVQSNDLFYAAAEGGIALYDASGNPVTGDVTSMIDLWDAGTEVNEEPGTGPNQAPRQSGPDTGMDENGNVMLVNDAYTYPADEDVIKVSLAHDGGAEFTLTIKNVSDEASFATPLAPGVWVIHSMGQTPLFLNGNPASDGLEDLAEDGDNSILESEFDENSGYVSPFAPGAFSLLNNEPVFKEGMSASATLEALAEDGDPSGFSNVFNTPVGGAAHGPIFPGESYEFTFEAAKGEKLSFATMLVQSNDLFIGHEGIKIFEDGDYLEGNITNALKLWDAYTELNEYPGAGNNQAPRQSAPDTGIDESGDVQEVKDGLIKELYRWMNEQGDILVKENYMPTSFETVKKKRHFYKVPKNRDEKVKVIK